MRFGLFYEHQLPRPWEDGAEQRLYDDALEQIEIAERAGFDYVWQVEHHFMEEYSHSSAPEVFLAAASQRTTRIRLGHGIVNVMPQVNHPARTTADSRGQHDAVRHGDHRRAGRRAIVDTEMRAILAQDRMKPAVRKP